MNDEPTALDPGGSETEHDSEATGNGAFPWPPAEGESAVEAAARTWSGSVLHPVAFFRRMPRDAPLGPALLYFLVVTAAIAGIQLFWDMVAIALLPAPAPGSAWTLLRPASAGEALIGFFFTPVFMIVVLFVGAAIPHALLKLMSGTGQRYGGTVRVLAYAQSAQLFAIVPVLGMLAGMVWTTVVAILGLREAHGTTTGKAAAAILLPIVLLFGFLLLAFIVLAAGALLLRTAA